MTPASPLCGTLTLLHRREPISPMYITRYTLCAAVVTHAPSCCLLYPVHMQVSTCLPHVCHFTLCVGAQDPPARERGLPTCTNARWFYTGAWQMRGVVYLSIFGHHCMCIIPHLHELYGALSLIHTSMRLWTVDQSFARAHRRITEVSTFRHRAWSRTAPAQQHGEEPGERPLQPPALAPHRRLGLGAGVGTAAYHAHTHTHKERVDSVSPTASRCALTR